MFRKKSKSLHHNIFSQSTWVEGSAVYNSRSSEFFGMEKLKKGGFTEVAAGAADVSRAMRDVGVTLNSRSQALALAQAQLRGMTSAAGAFGSIGVQGPHGMNGFMVDEAITLDEEVCDILIPDDEFNSASRSNFSAGMADYTRYSMVGDRTDITGPSVNPRTLFLKLPRRGEHSTKVAVPRVVNPQLLQRYAICAE